MSDAYYPQTIDLTASAIQLIRTALNNPKVTLDKTGLKSYDANGNLVTAINADGSASLTGLLDALGVVIPAGTFPVVTNQNEIEWTRPDGSVAATLSCYGQGESAVNLQSFVEAPGNLSKIELDANSDETGNAPSARLQVDNVNGITALTSAVLRIMDLAGNSSFVRLAGNPQNRAFSGSSASFNGNGTGASGNLTIAHGLGRVPVTVGAMLIGANGYFQEVAAADATNIHLQAQAASGLTFTNGVIFTFYWFAFG